MHTHSILVRFELSRVLVCLVLVVTSSLCPRNTENDKQGWVFAYVWALCCVRVRVCRGALVRPWTWAWSHTFTHAMRTLAHMPCAHLHTRHAHTFTDNAHLHTHTYHTHTHVACACMVRAWCVSTGGGGGRTRVCRARGARDLSAVGIHAARALSLPLSLYYLIFLSFFLSFFPDVCVPGHAALSRGHGFLLSPTPPLQYPQSSTLVLRHSVERSASAAGTGRHLLTCAIESAGLARGPGAAGGTRVSPLGPQHSGPTG